MDYKQLNELLNNLPNMKSKYKLITSSESPGYHDEKSGGDEGEKVEVWNVNLDDTFLKIIYHNDSYGEKEWIHKIQFVKAVTKTVQDYQSI